MNCDSMATCKGDVQKSSRRDSAFHCCSRQVPLFFLFYLSPVCFPWPTSSPNPLLSCSHTASFRLKKGEVADGASLEQGRQDLATCLPILPPSLQPQQLPMSHKSSLQSRSVLLGRTSSIWQGCSWNTTGSFSRKCPPPPTPHLSCQGLALSPPAVDLGADRAHCGGPWGLMGLDAKIQAPPLSGMTGILNECPST